MSPAAKSNAPEVDQEEILDEYPQEFLECRENHAWSRKVLCDPVDPVHSERIRECTNCGLRQVRTININTFQEVKRLTYRGRPKGYLTPGTGLTRDQFLARRFRAEFEEAAKSNLSKAVTPIKRKRSSKQAS